MKIVKKINVKKKPPQSNQEPEEDNLTEVEREFYEAGRLWNKGYVR